MGRRTPLYDRHVAAGARMVDFAGYDMPLQYSGIRDEHVGVRERAGIFDVSHMGEVAVNGPGAPDFVQRLVTNDVGRLVPNQLLYSVMCNERGGIVDDVIVMRGNRDNHFIIVVNASTREKDVAWMHEHAGSDVEVTDISDEIALIAAAVLFSKLFVTVSIPAEAISIGTRLGCGVYISASPTSKLTSGWSPCRTRASSAFKSAASTSPCLACASAYHPRSVRSTMTRGQLGRRCGSC